MRVDVSLSFSFPVKSPQLAAAAADHRIKERTMDKSDTRGCHKRHLLALQLFLSLYGGRVGVESRAFSLLSSLSVALWSRDGRSHSPFVARAERRRRKSGAETPCLCHCIAKMSYHL